MWVAKKLFVLNENVKGGDHPHPYYYNAKESIPLMNCVRENGETYFLLLVENERVFYVMYGVIKSNTLMNGKDLEAMSLVL